MEDKCECDSQSKMAGQQESVYFKGLENNSKARYKEKINLLGGCDPYDIKKDQMVVDIDKFPSVTYPDIANYFLFALSPLTKEELKAYKGLESYNQFVSGWVKEVSMKEFPNDKILVTGRVKHSQRMNDTPLSPWIIVEKSGSILAAHCNCMAGLGESCSHIGAVLFYIEYATRIRDSKTCTEEKAYWLLPGYHSVEYKEICDIDFSAAKTLQKNLDAKIENNFSTTAVIKKSCFTKYKTPTNNELNRFFDDLSKCGTKPAILSIVPGHSKNYAPKLLTELYPKSLSELYDSKLLNLNYKDLIDYCQNVELHVTAEQQSNVEIATRKQSLCKNWFHFRTGRITASKIHRVCHTNIAQPSITLVKEICYPENYKFQSIATKWGCDHEKVALNQYNILMEELHENFTSKDCGFYISLTDPFIGASPDALVFCNCCGDGCLEIKCPYKYREKFIYEIVACKDSYIKQDGENGIKLQTTHMYYYQIQCQLYVTGRKYCDFYVWTEKDYHYERVFQDPNFWKTQKGQCESFFKVCVLPELTGKFYTSVKPDALVHVGDKENLNNSSAENGVATKLYCYCQKEESGEMIACDSNTCKIEWYHVKCLRLSKIPKGKWICPDCRKIQSNSSKRLRKK